MPALILLQLLGQCVLDKVGFPASPFPGKHEGVRVLLVLEVLPHDADDVILVHLGRSLSAIGFHPYLSYGHARAYSSAFGSHSNPSACRLIAGSMHFLTSSSAAAARCKLVDDHFKQIFRDKINALLNVKATIRIAFSKSSCSGITRFSVYGQLFLKRFVFTFRVKSHF